MGEMNQGHRPIAANDLPRNTTVPMVNRKTFII